MLGGCFGIIIIGLIGFVLYYMVNQEVNLYFGKCEFNIVLIDQVIKFGV